MKYICKCNIVLLSTVICVLLFISSAQAQNMDLGKKSYTDYNAYNSNCYNAMSLFGNQGLLMPNLNGMDYMSNFYNGMSSQMGYGLNMQTDMFSTMTSPMTTMIGPTADLGCRWAGGGMNKMLTTSALLPNEMGYSALMPSAMGYPAMFDMHQNLFFGGFMPIQHSPFHFNQMSMFGWGGMHALSPFMHFGFPGFMAPQISDAK